MNRLAKAVGLDMCFGFMPAMNGEIADLCIERWIEVAKENKLRERIEPRTSLQNC
jgi:hypothetical protein